jgi:hypothetical protein
MVVFPPILLGITVLTAVSLTKRRAALSNPAEVDSLIPQ